MSLPPFLAPFFFLKTTPSLSRGFTLWASRAVLRAFYAPVQVAVRRLYSQLDRLLHEDLGGMCSGRLPGPRPFRIVLQVHDEIVLEVPDELNSTLRVFLELAAAMEGVVSLSVPLPVRIRCATAGCRLLFCGCVICVTPAACSPPSRPLQVGAKPC